MGQSGRARAAGGFHQRRASRLHDERKEDCRDVPRPVQGRRQAHHHRDVRLQPAPHPAGGRPVRRIWPEDLLRGAQHGERHEAGDGHRRDQDPAGDARRGGRSGLLRRRRDRRADHGQPGRADERPDPHGQQRAPQAADSRGRHGHRFRDADPGQRDHGLTHHRPALPHRRERDLQPHRGRARLRPRLSGGAQAHAGAGAPEVFYPGARRVQNAAAPCRNRGEDGHARGQCDHPGAGPGAGALAGRGEHHRPDSDRLGHGRRFGRGRRGQRRAARPQAPVPGRPDHRDRRREQGDGPGDLRPGADLPRLCVRARKRGADLRRAQRGHGRALAL